MTKIDLKKFYKEHKKAVIGGATLFSGVVAGGIVYYMVTKGNDIPTDGAEMVKRARKIVDIPIPENLTDNMTDFWTEDTSDGKTILRGIFNHISEKEFHNFMEYVHNQWELNPDTEMGLMFELPVGD